MATNDQYRINKDTSARKNTNHSDIRAALDAKATKKANDARHDVYVDAMFAGYEEEIENLKAQLSTQQKTLLQERQEAIDQAVAKAHTESNAQIAQLQKGVTDLRRQNEGLQVMFDEELAAKKTEIAAGKQEVDRIRNKVLAIKKAHASEVSDLQRQLAVGPNSWMEINLRCKGYKTRTYIRRPNQSFRSAVEELCKYLGRSFYVMSFEHKDQKITAGTKSLHEVCYALFGNCSTC